MPKKLNTKNKKSDKPAEDSYSLTISKRKNRALSTLFNVFYVYMRKNPIEVAMSIPREELEDIRDLVGEIADKEHALDWCNDPDCPVKKK